MRCKKILSGFILIALFSAIFLSDASAQNGSLEAILDEIEILARRVNYLESGDAASFKERLAQEDLTLIRRMNALRKPFLKALARQEGIPITGVRTRSLFDGLETFHHYFQQRGMTSQATEIAKILFKFFTMRGQILTHLDALFRNRFLFHHPKMQRFLSDPKAVEAIYRMGEVNYIRYFELVKIMTECHVPEIQTKENDFYFKASQMNEEYTRNRTLWLEMIRVTDSPEGEHTQGLKELLARGYFGKKEALRYWLTRSEGARMVRSMMVYYVMRAFSESYMGIYHWEGDRFAIYLKHVLTDIKTHAHFLTFVLTAERVAKLFEPSSAFRRLALKHPLFSQALLESAPLFSGMIVSDMIFEYVEHPSVPEIVWLAKQGEYGDARNLLFDLADDVWFRKSFLARAVLSTAIFTGYQLAVYSSLSAGGKFLKAVLGGHTKRSFFVKSSFSPLAAFISGVSAFIVHDLLMEKMTPALTEWDWEARIEASKKIVEDKLRQTEYGPLKALAYRSLLELDLSEDLTQDELLALLFQRQFVPYLEKKLWLDEKRRSELKKLSGGAFLLSHYLLGRAHQKASEYEKQLIPLAQIYPNTFEAFKTVSDILVTFELLNQAFESFREYRFLELYKISFDTRNAFLEQRQPLLDSFFKRAGTAGDVGDFHEASRIYLKAQKTERRLKTFLEEEANPAVQQALAGVAMGDVHLQRLQQNIWAAVALYPEKKETYHAYLNREQPFGFSNNNWHTLYSKQINYYFNLHETAPFEALKSYAENQVVTFFILAALKRYKVERVEAGGLEGWNSENMTDAQRKDLVVTLKFLDPESRSLLIRRLLSGE